MDLSDQRQHAEAVAYGKLLAVREVIDALHKARHPSRYSREHTDGYDHAVRVVKALRLGVEK